jgi:hypothetical protein
MNTLFAKRLGSAARRSLVSTSWLNYNGFAVSETQDGNIEARSLSPNEQEPMLFCPVCSRRLSERQCKLFCEQCGYYMSCADYY